MIVQIIFLILPECLLLEIVVQWCFPELLVAASGGTLSAAVIVEDAILLGCEGIVPARCVQLVRGLAFFPSVLLFLCLK